MKEQELRIGNYVICDLDNEIVKLKFIEGDTFCFNKPIPLTEEWLLKFGLKWGELRFDNRYFIGDELSIDYNKTHETFYLNIGHQFGINIEYLHHFQNIIFDLTNKELEIKELPKIR